MGVEWGSLYGIIEPGAITPVAWYSLTPGRGSRRYSSSSPHRWTARRWQGISSQFAAQFTHSRGYSVARGASNPLRRRPYPDLSPEGLYLTGRNSGCASRQSFHSWVVLPHSGQGGYFPALEPSMPLVGGVFFSASFTFCLMCSGAFSGYFVQQSSGLCVTPVWFPSCPAPLGPPCGA